MLLNIPSHGNHHNCEISVGVCKCIYSIYEINQALDSMSQRVGKGIGGIASEKDLKLTM